MRIKLIELTTDRKWSSSTGLDKNRFYILLEDFKTSYKILYGKTVSERNKECEIQEAIIKDEEELLFSLKSGLTYDLLGLVVGLDASNAKRHQNTGLNALKLTLSSNNYSPKREFKDVEEFKSYFIGKSTLILDALEQRIQRPKVEQGDSYSGKKNVIQ